MKFQQAEKDFEYYIDEFMYYCQSKRLRDKTLQSYEQTLRLFERWLRESEGITTPQKVLEPVIRKYICELQERGKYSFYINDERTYLNRPDRRRDYRKPIAITTINNYIRNLRVFFNYLFDREQIKRNPMAKIMQLKNNRNAREYLEDEEVKNLLNNFDKSYFAESRDYVIIILILDTGMRLGECLKLRVDYLDFAERAIMIPEEITKGRKTRYVYYSLKTAKILRNWMQYKDRYVESDYLFPTKQTGLPVSISSFETNFKNYIKRANIEKEISPHCLRNNFAKRCLLAGMDIYTLSRILGHSSVSVTEKAYCDLTDRDIKKRYEHFSPIEHIK